MPRDGDEAAAHSHSNRTRPRAAPETSAARTSYAAPRAGSPRSRDSRSPELARFGRAYDDRARRYSISPDRDAYHYSDRYNDRDRRACRALLSAAERDVICPLY